MRVVRFRQAKLRHDAADVLLHGPFGHPELPCDPAVRASFRHQRQHVELPRTQHLERTLGAAAGYEFLDERRLDDGAAAEDVRERIEEDVDV